MAASTAPCAALGRPAATGLDAQEADLPSFGVKPTERYSPAVAPAVREHRLAKRALAEARACPRAPVHAEPRDGESFGQLLRSSDDKHGHGGYPVMYKNGPAPCR